MPLIDISIGKSVFLNVERGLAVDFMKNRALEFGESLGYYESRLAEDSTKLTGLGDIHAGIDGRIFAKINLKDLALKSILSRKIDRHWSLKGVAGYKVLGSDAGPSPLVENLGSEHQLHFGAGLVYKF